MPSGASESASNIASSSGSNGKVVIAGGSGLIGTALAQRLHSDGWEPVILSRSEASGRFRSVQWDAKSLAESWISELESSAAVINLAGKSVFCRWDKDGRESVLSSRVQATLAIRRALEELQSPPKAWINASAIGFYGDRGGEVLTEVSPSGKGWFPQVCREWEGQVHLLKRRDVQTSVLRIGAVLSEHGGAFPKFIRLSRRGMLGRVGSGLGWVSWIHIDDLVELILRAISGEAAGLINATAPEPIQNRDFVQVLKRVSGGPFELPAPMVVLNLLGKFGAPIELFASSSRVLPTAAEAAGYQFKFRSFSDACEDLKSRLDRLG